MRHYLAIVGACAGASVFAGTAHAQSDGAAFCAAAGAYMHDIAVRRLSGATRDEAVEQVASEFDAFAAGQADLAARRRVLDVGPSLAAFAVDLDGLQPATVRQIGESYCLERGGDFSLAPSSSLSRAVRRCGSPVRGRVARCLDRVRGASGREARGQSRERDVACQPQGAPSFSRSTSLRSRTAAIPSGRSCSSAATLQEIDSGNGISAGGGFLHRFSDSFGMKYTAAYKVSFSAANNADVMKSVLPIDIVPYYQSGDHRFGVGLSYHVSPKVDWDWLMPTTSFDDATGVIFEYAWKRLSFSYTDIDYENASTSVDAGHFSVKYTSRH